MKNYALEEQKRLFNEFRRETFSQMDDLYNFAIRMTGNEKNAGSILTETYLKAFRFFSHLDSRINIKDWLFRILRNTYFDFSNKKISISKPTDEEVEGSYKAIKSSVTKNPEKILNINKDDLAAALAALPEDFKIVIVLSDIKKINHEKIAEFVDIPVGTVRSRLFRGRKMLFTKLYNSPDKKS